jgi:hypothetical protein
MIGKIAGAALVSGLALVGMAAPAAAQSPRKMVEVAPTAEHRASKVYRRGPQVRGFVDRGGYFCCSSYSAPDTVNTYGDSRARLGSNSNLRDPSTDRRANSGPFESGFIFDQGFSIGNRPTSSPYHN